MSAEIISEAGDDVTLAGSQGFQSCMRDFFCCLDTALEFFLLGNSVKFGLRRAWAKSAHADSIWFHLFGQSFCKQQIKGLGGSVGRNIRNGLEGGG